MHLKMEAKLIGDIRLLDLLLRNHVITENSISSLLFIQDINHSMLVPYISVFLSEYKIQKSSKVIRKALSEVIKSPSILKMDSNEFINLMAKKCQMGSSDFVAYISKSIMENEFLNTQELKKTDSCNSDFSLHVQATFITIFTAFLEYVFSHSKE